MIGQSESLVSFYKDRLEITAIALIFAVLSFVLDCRVDFEVMAV